MVRSFRSSPFYIVLVGLYIMLCVVLKITSSGISTIKFFTNQSASMYPLINQNSLTVVIKQDSYEIGDIITFYDNSIGKREIISHRIIGFGGNVYKTKGDANIFADNSIVKPRLIIGKVTLVVPYFGLALTFLKTGIGTLIFVLLPGVFFLIVELREILSVLYN